MPEEQAKLETTQAIAFAAPNHTLGSEEACTVREHDLNLLSERTKADHVCPS